MNKFGHPENYDKDLNTLLEIISRQGDALLLHAITRYNAGIALKFGLNDAETDNIKRALHKILDRDFNHFVENKDNRVKLLDNYFKKSTKSTT